MLVLYFVVISRVWIAIRFRFANLHSSRRLRVRVCDRERERERERQRERQRERERRAQRELCRSSAILQLICAAIARTVIGFLKITINSLRRPDTVCVCPTRRPHVHVQARCTSTSIPQHKKIEQLAHPSPAPQQQRTAAATATEAATAPATETVRLGWLLTKPGKCPAFCGRRRDVSQSRAESREQRAESSPFFSCDCFISVQLVIIFPIWNQHCCRLFTQIPIDDADVDCNSDLDRDSAGPA